MTSKKILRAFWIFLMILVIGGIGGVIINNYVLPRLIAWSWVAENGLFDATAERTTVIQKTEQVTVREDDSVEQIIAQPSTTTATLIFPKRVTGRVTEEEIVMPGVLVTNDGVIATYREDGATLPTPSVILNNGERHEVDLLGYDSFTNLLFYKVKKSTNTPTILFANSDDIRTGKKILLLKNGVIKNESIIDFAVMAGREHTLNLNGSVATSEKWEGVFGVTSGVTPAFVGAPVIAYNGEMVGMVGSLTEETSTRLFVLPANAVKAALSKVSNKQLITQAGLGVSYVSLTPENKEISSLGLEQGALVTELLARTNQVNDKFTAKKINIKVGDIITKVDDKAVTPSQPLSTLIYPKQKGMATTITIIRDGKEQVLTTTFE